ncbi:MAG: hypothetical protein KAT70_08750 [Thermoplasmata archaeon]|nr:hypothetical protein [Thermoplasmata archaeon]
MIPRNLKSGIRVVTHGGGICCLHSWPDIPISSGTTIMFPSAGHPDVFGRSFKLGPDYVWVRYDRPFNGIRIHCHCAKCLDLEPPWWHRPLIRILKWMTKVIQTHGLKPRKEKGNGKKSGT